MGSTVFPSSSSAPTAAEIAAAVAAPSAATIASAVAAPSAATIASTVAAAVPAIGAINTSVANNASPYGGTLTNLGVVNPGNVTTTTITGLGGYKYLKIFCIGNTTSASWAFQVRFNGDTGANYWSATGASHTVGGNGSFATDSIRVNLQSSSNEPAFAMIEIPDASTGALKMFTADSVTRVSGQNWVDSKTVGVWNTTSAITSIQVFTSNGSSWDNGCRIFITGAN